MRRVVHALHRFLRNSQGKQAGTAVVVGALALVPLFVDVDTSYVGYFLFLFFIYVIVTQAWNLVGGYTGLISLAQNAFFGLGAYTMALVWLNDLTRTRYYFDPVVMVLSGFAPAIVAVVVGLPLLSRLRGDYFSFGTLGVSQIVTVLFLKGGQFTGGADGLHLPSGSFTSLLPHYYSGLGLAVLATALVYWISRSRLGLALEAIREDEVSAASHGVNVLTCKLLVFATGAFLTGLGGCLYGYYLFHINPDAVLSFNWLFYPILACVLGGSGTIMGPIVGALVVTALFSFGTAYFPQTHPLVAGALIIAVMKFLPFGIVGAVKKRGGLASKGLAQELRR